MQDVFIKYRQRLKKKFVHDGEPFHYWGYIDGSFVGPLGKNYCDTGSDRFIGVQDQQGTDIYERDLLTTDLGKIVEVHEGAQKRDIPWHDVATVVSTLYDDPTLVYGD